MLFLSRHRIRFSVAVVGAVLLIALGCLIVSQTFGKSTLTPTLPLSTNLPPPPPSANQPPIYPNATNVITDFANSSIKLVSFETSDPAADVQKYYGDVLQKDGWKLETVSEPATPDSLYLSWGGTSLGSYRMDILISSATDGLLNVKITLVYHNLIM